MWVTQETNKKKQGGKCKSQLGEVGATDEC